MKYVLMTVLAMVVAACVGNVNDPRTFDDPNAYALGNDGGVCDTHADARAEVLSRLGIDEAECQARPGGTDACADDAPVQGPGTIVLSYAPYMTGTWVRVSREPGGQWWSVVCSCEGCSQELGFDPSTWTAPLHVSGKTKVLLFP